MTSLSQIEHAVSTLDLQHLVADYCHELDTTAGLEATRLLTKDCCFDLGQMQLRGHEEIQRFYEDFAAKVQASAAVRTTRHVATNMRITVEDASRAQIDFVVLNFSGSGTPPLATGTVPTIVSDAHFECLREADGRWRIARFTGGPVFVGDDPLQNQALMASAVDEDTVSQDRELSDG